MTNKKHKDYEVYMGDSVFKGKRYYNAKHEPIVSRELFSICQNIIKSHTSGKSSKHDFSFSNLIKCSKCGCYMVGEIKKGAICLLSLHGQ